MTKEELLKALDQVVGNYYGSGDRFTIWGNNICLGTAVDRSKEEAPELYKYLEKRAKGEI